MALANWADRFANVGYLCLIIGVATSGFWRGAENARRGYFPKAAYLIGSVGLLLIICRIVFRWLSKRFERAAMREGEYRDQLAHVGEGE